MKKEINCLVIMPVGPRSKLDYVQDTLHSFLYYFDKSDSVILVLDDTRGGALKDITENNDRVRIVNAQQLISDTNREHNTRGMLFLKQVLALRTLSKEFEWKCLLRLDDDALVIGPNPHLDALEKFAENPVVGMLGAYLRRGDGEDKRPALRKQGRKLIKRIISGDIVRNPELIKTLVSLVFRAKVNHYKLGDMCTGGALFVSGEACRSVDRLLGTRLMSLKKCDLADDLLLALCLGAAGYKFEDFSDPGDVMAINWRGLPMPLNELVERQKKLLHPTKDPGNESHERKVRQFFKDNRRLSGPNT